MNPIFISFYTLNGYEKEAERLIRSLEKFNLEYDVQEYCSTSSWEEITAYKPRFIAEMIAKHNRPVVWLDADAEVMEYPELFFNLDCNIAYHKRFGRQVLSGTVYIDNSIKSVKMLSEWYRMAKNDLKNLEQWFLDKAINKVEEIAITYLPVEYCTVFDGKDRPSNPIIIHYQASRRYRKQTRRTK